MTQCSVEGCARPIKARGLCGTHYVQLLRTGSPQRTRAKSPTPTIRQHRLYPAWAGMVSRCHNPNHTSFDRYGARGIVVCERWRKGEDGRSGFECYLADLGERPDGMTLDRIDPVGPYSPENCRWATVKEQRANISADGDQRMRRAMGAGVKARWDRWRRDQADARLSSEGEQR